MLIYHFLLLSPVAMAEQQRSNQPDLQKQPIKKPKNIKSDNPKRFFSDNHSFKKRPTSKPYQRKEDIYVTNKSNFKVKQVHFTNHKLFTFCSTTLIFCLIILPTIFQNFQAQINQCETILNTENINEIFLHCVGNAISRGINLALTLIANSNNGLGYEANTSFIELIGSFTCCFALFSTPNHM